MGIHLTKERRATECAHMAAVNWIEDARKDNDSLAAGSFPNSELDGIGKAP